MDTCVIRIGRALDFLTVDAFKALCAKEMKSGINNFILDFGDAGILGSTALGAIFSVDRKVQDLGGSIVFTHVKGAVAAIVTATRIDRHFAIYESLNEALSSIDAGRVRHVQLSAR